MKENVPQARGDDYAHDKCAKFCLNLNQKDVIMPTGEIG